VIKRILVIILTGMLPTLAYASAVSVNYAGHYELVDNHPDRIFTLDLSQSGSRVKVAFFAAVLNDPGAKPSGKGLGRVNEQGVLEFTFKDSFANEGIGTLEPASNGYRIEMRITKFVDPAPLHFYGDLTMKRTSDKLQKIVSSG
jgi:hypothetical protein